MSLFGKRQNGKRCGAVIDIGSGSVLVSIVFSDPKLLTPTIIWSHREQAPLKNIDSLGQSSKAVMTALVNASMLLDSEGRKALKEFSSHLKISELQCSISAPWSHTVTKTINYNDDKEFEITKSLINEFNQTIATEVESDFAENSQLKELNLTTISKIRMDLSANGYHITNPEGNKATELKISQAHSVAQQTLIDAIDEIQEKLIPGADTKKLSFILILFAVTRELLNQTYDTCLVDVTYEATEIGVVRDGALNYSTHTPFGSFSIAREISEITKAPLSESFGYLHTEKPYQFLDYLTEKQKVEVELVFQAYIERISNLFNETGDSLSIPKQISVHSNLRSENLFIDLIKKAAKKNLKSEPKISSVSSEIIRQTYKQQTTLNRNLIPEDTALMLSAQFFHTEGNLLEFKHF
jgi:Tfp pilus assembly PilM family ATPase